MKNKKLMSILLVSAILGTTLGTTAVSAADETSVSLWTWSPITRTAEKMIDAFEKQIRILQLTIQIIIIIRNTYRHFLRHLHLIILLIS